jgi:hypothetical protein
MAGYTRTDVDTSVGIVDGRVSMSADGDADLLVETPDTQPLSSIETHATLRISGDDYRAEIDLDADDLDWLVDVLKQAKEGEA